MSTATITTRLAARSLSAGYDAVPVLREVSMEVAAGEVVALLGPNGAGKTTLLRTLAGLHRPSAGYVEFDGERCTMAAHQRARRGMAFIADDRQAFPSLTIRQTMRVVRRSVTGLVDDFPELARRVNVRAGLLSGGEQQMLALGRALSTEPSVIVVDELSLGLAPMIRSRLLQFLRHAADGGAAVLVVEQNVSDVLAVADRSYVLRRGEIVDTRPAGDWAGHLDELGSLYLS